MECVKTVEHLSSESQNPGPTTWHAVLALMLDLDGCPPMSGRLPLQLATNDEAWSIEPKRLFHITCRAGGAVGKSAVLTVSAGADVLLREKSKLRQLVSAGPVWSQLLVRRPYDRWSCDCWHRGASSSSQLGANSFRRDARTIRRHELFTHNRRLLALSISAPRQNMRLANAFCSTASLDEWRIIERHREYICHGNSSWVASDFAQESRRKCETADIAGCVSINVGARQSRRREQDLHLRL